MYIPTRFNHCFTFSDRCGVYATPYSNAGIDFMADAVIVCQSRDDSERDMRTAQILTMMCNYWGIILEEIAEGRDGENMHVYALRHFYSLANRIESVWGRYAARSIFSTMGWVF